MTTPMLALPSGERTRPRHLLSFGAMLAGVASLMAFGGLIAAYLAVRNLAAPWPPKGVRVDAYLGAVVTITAVMTSVMVEWGASAVRRGVHRQAIGALALTMLMGLAWLNGIWYAASQLHLPVARNAYAGVTYALLALSLINVVGSLIGVGVSLAKVAGRQQGPADDQIVRAVAWYWHFAVTAWVCVYSTLYLLK